MRLCRYILEMKQPEPYGNGLRGKKYVEDLREPTDAGGRIPALPLPSVDEANICKKVDIG